MKSLKADILSDYSSNNGLMFKTSAFKLFTVANLHYQLSW